MTPGAKARVKWKGPLGQCRATPHVGYHGPAAAPTTGVRIPDAGTTAAWGPRHERTARIASHRIPRPGPRRSGPSAVSPRPEHAAWPRTEDAVGNHGRRAARTDVPHAAGCRRALPCLGRP